MLFQLVPTSEFVAIGDINPSDIESTSHRDRYLDFARLSTDMANFVDSAVDNPVARTYFASEFAQFALTLKRAIVAEDLSLRRSSGGNE